MSYRSVPSRLFAACLGCSLALALAGCLDTGLKLAPGPGLDGAAPQFDGVFAETLEAGALDVVGGADASHAMDHWPELQDLAILGDVDLAVAPSDLVPEASDLESDSCAGSTCGDGECAMACGESEKECPEDCCVFDGCGDGKCKPSGFCGESVENCPADCL